MTTTNTLPELDVEMIFKLIKWAEQDETFLANLSEWGFWNQGVWGAVAQHDAETVLGDAVSAHDIGPDEEQQLRNGACQTAYCMAGQAVVQNGYRLVYQGADEVNLGDAWRAALTASECIRQEQAGVSRTGRPLWRDAPGAVPMPISDTAQRLLGLTSDERYRFFDGDNELGQLKEYANGMCHRRGLPLLFPDDAIYDFNFNELPF